MSLPLVILKPLRHRNGDQLGIYFSVNAALNRAVRGLAGIKWSQEHRCWYLHRNVDNLKAIRVCFSGLAGIDETFLKPDAGNTQPVQEAFAESRRPAARQPVAPGINSRNRAALENFVQELQLKAYSPSTIKTYRNEFLQLLKLLADRFVDDLTIAQLKRYMAFAMEQQGISENTAHSRLNALKLYFEQCLKREKFFWEIPRPQKPEQLPRLLNEAELARLFNALTNKKHKAMLFTAYSAGLRVSEVVHLKIKDIDSERMQILVVRSKGKKDRYVNLSPVLLDILRKYIADWTPRPTQYLFESDATRTCYPVRTVQQIFSTAKLKAGILKQVGFHSLRHSFATHLLDKGTDIKYIKDLLGHFDIRTTERYLHVSKQQLVNIISPLDDLFTKKKVDW